MVSHENAYGTRTHSSRLFRAPAPRPPSPLATAHPDIHTSPRHSDASASSRSKQLARSRAEESRACRCVSTRLLGGRNRTSQHPDTATSTGPKPPCVHAYSVRGMRPENTLIAGVVDVGQHVVPQQRRQRRQQQENSSCWTDPAGRCVLHTPGWVKQPVHARFAAVRPITTRPSALSDLQDSPRVEAARGVLPPAGNGRHSKKACNQHDGKCSEDRHCVKLWQDHLCRTWPSPPKLEEEQA